MQSKIDQYTTEIQGFEPKTAEELENFRIQFLGTKGIIKDLFDEFKLCSTLIFVLISSNVIIPLTSKTGSNLQRWNNNNNN